GLVGGLLGVGGSTIIIPAMIVYLSHTARGYSGSLQHLLQASAMICNVFIALPAVLAHRRARAIMPPVVRWLVPSAFVGIISGVVLSNSSAFARENGRYLAIILAVFLGYVAVYNIWRYFRKTNLTEAFDPEVAMSVWKIILVGLPMGFVAGLLGIGGGALCVPAQQIVLRLPLRRAIANSAVTIMCVSFCGAIYKNMTLAGHGLMIKESLTLAAMLVPTAIIGSYIGGRLTHVLPRKVLRISFIVFMVTVMVITLSKAIKAGAN
ncbi:MAG: sulfite exporter TauE/SafE family protein, partial [Phycisphaerae bacterium]|nr:sulfite exporter TauE/SafE family protein [Phycisphaerae bacterium]